MSLVLVLFCLLYHECGTKEAKIPYQAQYGKEMTNLDPLQKQSDYHDKKNKDEAIFVDGVNVKALNMSELQKFLDKLDKTLAFELEYLSLRNHIQEKLSSRYYTGKHPHNQRVKRQTRRMGSGGYKCSAAGGMFRGSVRSGPMTSSGTRTTQNYDRTGNYGKASKDFDSFAPQNVKPFSKPYKEGTLSGQTGNIGNHRITIRDGSKKDTPTLEIRSPRPDGSTHVRKFRYQENEEGQN